MGRSKVVLGIVLATVLVAMLFTVVLDGGHDDRCTPDSGGSLGGVGGVPDGELSKPLRSSEYQVSSTYKSPDRPGHRGIDLAAPTGTAMYSMADGVVAQAGPASGFGNWIVIDHEIEGSSYSTVYGHMYDDGVDVAAGDTVKAGQHIGEVGSNGQSTGPHLHFEVWEGGRFGGAETDPAPWIEKAVDPGGGDTDSADEEPDPTPAPKDSPGRRVSSRADGGELQPTDKLGSEDNMQVDAIRGARAAGLRFPEVQTIGGWRANVGAAADHPQGRAIDIMIPDYDSTEGRDLGNRIQNYFLTHAEHFNVEYTIWRQELTPVGGTKYLMEDRGSPTDNHFDHVHVTFAGGGAPTSNQTYGAAPSGGADDSSSSPVPTATGECEFVGPHSGRDLADGEIPEELRKWISLGGRKCAAIDPPLLAGLIYHESAGFQADAVSTAGAQGYGQFMPDTWAGVGAKVDENGEIAGPPGSGSPSDPADATMAAARYLCQIADGQKEGIASGRLKGDPQSLMLAGYNAGPGAVEQYGGVPPYAETQKYVVIVPQEAERFAATAGKGED
ncbi:peptidoglycan DD-metalloendopeptidase family protein [Dietzia sp. 179-F 9C3 NHS]|uniref:peptidoglycan DD-metalloendopeptidase family protein n=1 Tax=Dietzia sp. 179-F 9C3 NHS TaxID=3374295 RepID=UPI00387A45AA